MRSITFTHKGKRDTNQDLVLIESITPKINLMLIADGMGGYEKGELAAHLVVDNVLTYLTTVNKIGLPEIQKAINKANLAIRQEKEKSNLKIGATIGGIIRKSNQAICFWVGDVKIFHFINNKLFKESTSHTLMNEVISNGSIKDPKQINKYKHVVTRSVQGEIALSQIESFNIENVGNEDLLIICSDGVYDIMDGLYIEHVLKSNNSIEESMVEIENQLLKYGTDNFSLICITG
jgi:protein phosphatase